jgi:hypothetical protein
MCPRDTTVVCTSKHRFLKIGLLYVLKLIYGHTILLQQVPACTNNQFEVLLSDDVISGLGLFAPMLFPCSAAK